MYRVEVRHKKDFTFTVKSGDHEFTVDAKGKDGVAPPDVLLASLGSCIGVYIRKYTEGAKLLLEGFCVKVEADFCKEPPASFKAIYVSVDLQGLALDERRKIALTEFVKNCPVHHTLKGSPEVTITIG